MGSDKNESGRNTQKFKEADQKKLIARSGSIEDDWNVIKNKISQSSRKRVWGKEGTYK